MGTPQENRIASSMKKTLINTRDFPPGGYLYREPELNWVAPEPLQGLEHTARQLQMVRSQNLAAGLDPSYDACVDAIKDYTAHRLNYNPKWCGTPPDPVDASGNPVKKTYGCKSCGRR